MWFEWNVLCSKIISFIVKIKIFSNLLCIIIYTFGIIEIETDPKVKVLRDHQVFKDLKVILVLKVFRDLRVCRDLRVYRDLKVNQELVMAKVHRDLRVVEAHHAAVAFSQGRGLGLPVLGLFEG